MTKIFFGLRVVGIVLLFSSCIGSAFAEQFAIQIGDTISDGVPGVGAGRIDVNTETDQYTFTGSAGQSIFLEELSVASSFAGWLKWEIKSPGNVTVFSSYLEGNNEGRRTLPENGTYTLRVWVGAVNPAYIGTYAFRLRAIPADPTIPIQIGDTITNGVPAPSAGHIEVPGAWDFYTFNATNGQIVFFEIPNVASTFQGYLVCELKSPSSNSVFSSYITAGNNPGRKVLSETGTYRIRVFAQSNSTNHVGTYSIRIRPVPADQYFAIQPGDTVTNNIPAAGAGSIDAPGAQDFYTFSGTAGQGITFQGISKSIAFAGYLQWEVKTSGGQNLFSSYFGDMGRKTLPETGTYTIRLWVGANNTSYLGNYSFRLYTLPGDVQCAIQKGDTVSDGVPLTGAGRIDEPGGMDTYTFTGIAGQRVNFDQLTAAPAFAGYLYWQITAPSSNWFAGYFPGGTTQRRTLPESGTYTIRVYANSVNTAFIGPYSFRTWCEVVARPDQFATLPNSALTIPINKFLCNDSLEIGDVPVVDTPIATSANGGSITTTNGTIIYTPPVGFTGVDTFTYRLHGQFGDEDTAIATVRVGAGVNQGAMVVSLLRESPTSVMVCLLGAPNQNYIVEQSTDFTSWSNIGSVTADGAGSMTYSYAVETAGKRFYRFRKP
jgi:hypothetical protein